MQKNIYWLVILLVLFGISAIGCSDDGKDQPDGDLDGDTIDGDLEDAEMEGEAEDESGVDVSEQVARGVDWLENGEAVLANVAFKEAFELNSNDPQARFGYAFTESLVAFELFADTILGAVTGIGDMLKTSAPKPPPADYETWDDWFDQELVTGLNLMADRFNKSVELYGPLKEQGGLSMTFNRLPVYVGLDEPTVIKGEIDDADVFFFDAMSRTFAILLDFINAHHVKSDLATLIAVIAPELDGVDITKILGIVAYLLNYEEKFLAFRDGGKQQVIDTGDLMLGALQDVLDGVEAAEAELATDSDQEDEFFVVVDKRGVINLKMQIWTLDKDEEAEEMKQVTILTADEVQAVGGWRDQIRDGGDPTPMDSVVMPTIASAAILPIAFGLLDSLGLELGLDPALITPGILVGLINGFVNFDVLALDLHAYYQDPKPLRAMMPYWTSDKPKLENSLLLEWECSEAEMEDGLPDGSAGLFCADSEGLIDAPHFVGTDFEIAADGHTVITPYIAFSDPTLGNMMYVNIPALELPDYSNSPEWQKADQMSFNAALGKVLAKVGGLLGK